MYTPSVLVTLPPTLCPHTHTHCTGPSEVALLTVRATPLGLCYVCCLCCVCCVCCVCGVCCVRCVPLIVQRSCIQIILFPPLPRVHPLPAFSILKCVCVHIHVSSTPTTTTTGIATSIQASPTIGTNIQPRHDCSSRSYCSSIIVLPLLLLLLLCATVCGVLGGGVGARGGGAPRALAVALMLVLCLCLLLLLLLLLRLLLRLLHTSNPPLHPSLRLLPPPPF